MFVMRYLSLFSGIEAASVAWAPLGWECVGFSEIEPFPARLLKHHYHYVKNLGDVTKITEADIAILGHIDLIVFGSPCQDLSVAGKQKGLAGERSGLFFAAMHIIGWAREWCDLRGALWENVPGAFSSNKGADFAAVVGALAGLECSVPPKGWGTEGCAVGSEAMVEWSVLDAQWFGVPQRRRRVFALADFGDWAGRPPILLEPEGLRGDSAPSRGTGQEVAGTLSARTAGGGGLGTDFDLAGGLQAFGGNNTSGPIDVSAALNACGTASGRMDFESETFIAHAFDARQSDVCQYGAVTGPLDTDGHTIGVLQFQGGSQQDQVMTSNGVSPTLAHSSCTHGGHHQPKVMLGSAVRRLTPTECERLQGFPDGYTNLGKDGPRYKALGNSMAVPVMNWIGRQIDYSWTYF